MTTAVRPFTVLDVAQRSPEWFQARLGRLTSSRANDMLATVQKGEAAGRRHLRIQLALERITGKSQERSFRQSAAMEHGVETEARAAMAYEAITGSILTATGFVSHTSLSVGCSLDGHFGDFEGIVEIKCPESATHLEYLTSGKVPTKYLRQISHALWVTGAAWCDFLSFDPDFPESLQAKLIRVTRADVDLNAYQSAALAFLSEVETVEQALRTMANPAAQFQAALGAMA